MIITEQASVEENVMPKTAIAGCSVDLFRLFENSQCWFLEWPHQFAFPQTTNEGFLFPTPLAAFMVSYLWILIILTGVRWNPKVVLICFSLIVKYHFGGVSWAFWFLLRTMFRSVTHYFMGCLILRGLLNLFCSSE